MKGELPESSGRYQEMCPSAVIMNQGGWLSLEGYPDRAVLDGSPSSLLHRQEEISQEAGTEQAMQSNSIPASHSWAVRLQLHPSLLRVPATPWSLCLPPHCSAPRISLHSPHMPTSSAKQGQSLSTQLAIKNLWGTSIREKKSL